MAWAWTHITSYLVIFYCSLIGLSDLYRRVDSSSIGARHRHRPPMVIPLQFSSHNSSLRLSAENRRHLQQSELPTHTPNARMRLYDDLLSNGLFSFCLFFPCYSVPFYRLVWVVLNFLFLWLYLQLLHDAAMDWIAAPGVCSDCRFGEYCNLCSMFYLWTLRQASGLLVLWFWSIICGFPFTVLSFFLFYFFQSCTSLYFSSYAIIRHTEKRVEEFYMMNFRIRHEHALFSHENCRKFKKLG